MINAYVSSAETVVIAQGLLWQFDRGQLLEISGVSLPFSFKTDFCNAGDATTQPMTGTDNTVAIPDSFLLDGRPVIAFVVVPDENNERETIYKIIMPVVARPRPTDISPTPQEEEDIDSLIAAMNAAVEAAQDARDQVLGMSATAETLPAGSDATVSYSDGVMHFGIPRGEDGGGGGTSDYTDLTNKPQINGHTLSGNQSAADLGLDNIFWATYGVTTSAEIEAAYQAGKYLLCKHTYNGRDFVYAFTRRQSSTIHDFGLCYWGDTSPIINAVYCQNDSWHGYARNVAALNSPAFTGTPTAPTADPGTDSTQIATTEFVQNAISGIENQLVPSGGASGYVLKKASSDSFDLEWAAESGGGGAVDSVNGQTGTVVLTASDVGAVSVDDYMSDQEVDDIIDDATGVDPGDQQYLDTLPPGGKTGEVLKKASDTDYDVEWANETGGGVTSVNGQTGTVVLTASDVGAATESYVDSAISQSTAFYRGNFATKAALVAVAWQTSDPEAAYYVTNNDYAVVLDDETQNDECWRYIYVTGTGWTAQYKINDTPLTQAQLDALNSGATSAIITSISSKAEDFWCTYGTTTSAQIEAAYQAGKIVKLKYSDKIYELVYRGASTSHTFAAPYNGSSPCIYGVYCSSDVWSASSAILITAPSSPTNGQILAYNNGWVAETPVPEVTVATAGAVTQALDAGKVYHFTGALTSLTLTLNAAPTGRLAQYHFDFNSGSTATTLTLAGVNWPSGSFTPDASKRYEVDILNGYGVYLEW